LALIGDIAGLLSARESFRYELSVEGRLIPSRSTPGPPITDAS